MRLNGREDDFRSLCHGDPKWWSGLPGRSNWKSCVLCSPKRYVEGSRTTLGCIYIKRSGTVTDKFSNSTGHIQHEWQEGDRMSGRAKFDTFSCLPFKVKILQLGNMYIGVNLLGVCWELCRHWKDKEVSLKEFSTGLSICVQSIILFRDRPTINLPATTIGLHTIIIRYTYLNLEKIVQIPSCEIRISEETEYVQFIGWMWGGLTYSAAWDKIT